MYKVKVSQKKQNIKERYRVRDLPRVHSVLLCSECCVRGRRSTSAEGKTRCCRWSSNCRPGPTCEVQSEELGRQTALLSKGATESRVMPVRHEMLDQHLCKVMPAMRTRPERQTTVLRGATESRGAHYGGTGATSISDSGARRAHTDQTSRRLEWFSCLLLRVARAGRWDETSSLPAPSTTQI